MLAKEIRNWCLKQPRPKLLRIHCADDRVQEMKPPRNGANWAQTATTIAALQPYLLEAYDNEGGLLRAMRDDVDDPMEDDEPRPPSEIVVPAALAGDPHAQMLTHFSNLLFRAHQFSTQVAFEKMVAIFDLLAQRSEAQDARLERTETHLRRTLQSQVDDAFDQAAAIAEGANGNGQGAPDIKNKMIETFFASYLQGQMQKATATPHANGTTKPNGGKS